jgi:hypothetical protein
MSPLPGSVEILPNETGFRVTCWNCNVPNHIEQKLGGYDGYCTACNAAICAWCPDCNKLISIRDIVRLNQLPLTDMGCPTCGYALLFNIGATMLAAKGVLKR